MSSDVKHVFYLFPMMLKSHEQHCHIAGVGLTKARWAYFFVREIFDFEKVPVRFLEKSEKFIFDWCHGKYNAVTPVKLCLIASACFDNAETLGK